ncbi:hypothetical protein EsH8_X_000695 [Colletotrichum jinshuiense]
MTTNSAIPAPLGDVDDIPDSGYSTEPASQSSDDGKAQSPQEEETYVFKPILSGLEKPIPETSIMSVDILWKVRILVSEMIEIPIEEVPPSTSLEILGIDSFLVTEVLAEVLTQFDVQISQEQFSECTDVRDVTNLLQKFGPASEKSHLTCDPVSEAPAASVLAVDGQLDDSAKSTGPAVATPAYDHSTKELTEYLESVLSRLEGKRQLKILELGAGTGGTTKTVVETLDRMSHDANFTYTFTDLSPSLVAAARRKFAHWHFMENKVMDIEKEPQPEFQGAYDIILSTNCIHATRDLVLSTTNIRKMLKPDGLLCLVELTRNLYWFDLVLGLLEGW